MGLRISGFILMAAAFGIVSTVLYRNSGKADIPLVYAPTQVLNATWNNYKQDYIQKDSGRTVDPDRENITTSEGQSYTMLRAVWLGDKATYDASWKFTHDNLQHSGDSLFSWLYGKKTDGTFGVLTTQGGATSASDADSDIALSLVFAYARWQDPAYLTSARTIISDIWNKEVIVVDGTPYLVADNLETSSASNTALINPSYLSPYSYRLFAKIDPAHPWNKLVDSSYTVLQKSTTATLSGTKGGLPPDWIALDKKTGALTATTQASLSSNYGYDALRVPWRVAMDWQWNKEPRAKDVLGRMTPLADAWQKNAMLGTVYSHSGTPIGTYESPAMYGGAIGYFLVTNPSEAQKLYTDKLVFLYNPDSNSWKQQLSYYDDNWAWFGIGLYNNLLPNLASGLPSSAFAYQQ